MIAERLSAYEHETAPLLEHYKERGLLTVVDGHGTFDEVYRASATSSTRCTPSACAGPPRSCARCASPARVVAEMHEATQGGDRARA